VHQEERNRKKLKEKKILGRRSINIKRSIVLDVLVTYQKEIEKRKQEAVGYETLLKEIKLKIGKVSIMIAGPLHLADNCVQCQDDIIEAKLNLNSAWALLTNHQNSGPLDSDKEDTRIEQH